MSENALTPLEASVLIVLMTQGKPVRQADFALKHGLQVRKQHRQKLEDRGLIEVKFAPHLTYVLTGKSWAWLKNERANFDPRHAGTLAPLFAALNVVETLARRLGLTLEQAMKAEAPQDDIREPEWIDADEYLARALQDISVFAGKLNQLREAAKRNFEEEIESVGRSADLVFQHVQLAALKRALALEGQVGEEATYDPVLFYSDDELRCGAPIRIRKPTVTRGHGSKKIVVQPGLANAILDG